ncbi:MAG: helix-turn-helix domain-containing protein [Thermoplasmata archaeon]
MIYRPPLAVDPRLAALLGSANRVRTLAPLANAYRPMTAYRVARLAGIPRTKVYRELRRLLTVGVVGERRSRKGTSTWTLLDADMALYLRKKIRVAWSRDLAASATPRAEKERRLAAALRSESWFNPAKYRPNPSVAARYAAEIERPEGKGEFAGRAARVSRKRR